MPSVAVAEQAAATSRCSVAIAFSVRRSTFDAISAPTLVRSHFSCDACFKSYALKDTLLRHVRRYHLEDHGRACSLGEAPDDSALANVGAPATSGLRLILELHTAPKYSQTASTTMLEASPPGLSILRSILTCSTVP